MDMVIMTQEGNSNALRDIHQRFARSFDFAMNCLGNAAKGNATATSADKDSNEAVPSGPDYERTRKVLDGIQLRINDEFWLL